MLILSILYTTQACIGTGCIFDKMEERFYWFSRRAVEEVPNVLDAGGPASYCSSLGLAVTAPGSSLYKRAEILLRYREASDPIVSSASLPRTVCHEEKWDERGPSSSILYPLLTALSGDEMYCDIWHQSRAVTVGA